MVQASAAPDASDERRPAGWLGWATSLPVLVGVLAVVVLALGSLAVRSPAHTYDQPIDEDGFYALSIARHVADGDGVTIDGRTETNGFQPLFTFITVPTFTIAGDDTPLAFHLVLALDLAVLLATGLVLGFVVADASTRLRVQLPRGSIVLLVTIATVAASRFIATNVNGLETGFLLLVYAVIWREYQVRGLRTVGDDVILGVLCGMLVLTRVDAVFFVAVACLGIGFVLHRWRSALTIGALAVVVSSPWWVWNTLRFGSPMPISGKAQHGFALSGHRAVQMFEALVQNAVPWLYAPSFYQRLAPTAVQLVVIAAGLLLYRRLRADPALDGPGAASGDDRVTRARDGAVVLTVTAALFAGWYLVSTWAYWFFPRYTAVLMLVAVFLWVRLALLAWRRTPRLVLGGFALVAAGGVLIALAYSDVLPFGPRRNGFADQLALVRRTVPATDAVAAGQTGTLGFFRDRVVNLDGKVNADALERRGDLDRYVAEQRIHWLCDEPAYLHRWLGDLDDLGWRRVARQGAFTCYRRP